MGHEWRGSTQEENEMWWKVKVEGETKGTAMVAVASCLALRANCIDVAPNCHSQAGQGLIRQRRSNMGCPHMIIADPWKAFPCQSNTIERDTEARCFYETFG